MFVNAASQILLDSLSYVRVEVSLSTERWAKTVCTQRHINAPQCTEAAWCVNQNGRWSCSAEDIVQSWVYLLDLTIWGSTKLDDETRRPPTRYWFRRSPTTTMGGQFACRCSRNKRSDICIRTKTVFTIRLRYWCQYCCRVKRPHNHSVNDWHHRVANTDASVFVVKITLNHTPSRHSDLSAMWYKNNIIFCDIRCFSFALQGVINYEVFL